MPNDLVESRRDVPSRFQQPRRLVPQDGRNGVADRLPKERPLAREQLIENRPEREKVASVIDENPSKLLGRHIAHRPHHHPGLRVPHDSRRARRIGRGDGLDSLRHAEVEDLDVAVLRHEHVLRLQVAMDHALLVRRGKAVDDLERVVERLPLKDWSRIELLAQGLALEKLHDRIGDALVSSEVVNRENVRMRKRRDRLRFALEPRQRVGIAGDGRGQDLDRDVPIELRVPRLPDLSHPARAERREDLVRPETRAPGEMGIESYI